MNDAAGALAQLRETLPASAARLGLHATDAQIDRLLEFVGLLDKWNRTYNLTSIRDVDAMVSHHVVDCLAVIEPLRREIGLRQSPRVLDVGSGGGLPGVVIAVMDPCVSVTCVDAVGKKAAFVQHVASSLHLHNLRSEHSRVESLPAAPYDIVTSRAFASLGDFVSVTRRLLRSDGVWMAMKGRRPTEEIGVLPSDVDVFHVEPLASTADVGERCLVWMRPSRQVSADSQATSASP